MKIFNFIATVSLFLLILVSCEKEVFSDRFNETNPVIEVFGPKVELIRDLGSIMLGFASEEHFIEVYNRIALRFESEGEKIINTLKESTFQNIQKVLQNNAIDSIFSNHTNLTSEEVINGEKYDKIIAFPSVISLFLNEDAQIIIGENIVQFTETVRLSIDRSHLRRVDVKVDLRKYPNVDVFLTTNRPTNARACSVVEDCEVFWLSGNRRTDGAVQIFVPSAGSGTVSTLSMSVTNWKKVFLGWKSQAAGELGLNWSLTINSVLYSGSIGPSNTHHHNTSIVISATPGTCPSVSGSVTVYAHEHNCTMYPTG